MGFGKSLPLLYGVLVSGGPPEGGLESSLFQCILHTILSTGTWACPCPVGFAPCVWEMWQVRHPHLTGENTKHREGKHLTKVTKLVRKDLRISLASGCSWVKCTFHYRIFQAIRHTPPNMGGKWRCVLWSKCSLPGSLWEGRRWWSRGFFPIFLL